MTREKANARLAQIKTQYSALEQEVIQLCREHNLTFTMPGNGKRYYATEHSFMEHRGLDEEDMEYYREDMGLEFPMWVGSSDLC